MLVCYCHSYQLISDTYAIANKVNQQQHITLLLTLSSWLSKQPTQNHVVTKAQVGEKSAKDEQSCRTIPPMSDSKEGLPILISLYSTCPTLLVSASAKNAYTLATDGDELFSTRFTNPFVETCRNLTFNYYCHYNSKPALEVYY